MGELGQYHPSFKISRIKELPNGDFVVIGDSVQDVNILQNESKMKAALGKNVKISLPKAFLTSKVQTKSLASKGVPTDTTDIEFKEFPDLNKISYAKAERLESKRTVGSSQSFCSKLTILPKALISQNLVCQVTSIAYEVEQFRSPVSVTQCFNCQSFGHSAKNCRSKQKCLICGESHSHKGCPNREARKPKCANCKEPHVASYKGCQEYKKQAFRQHVVKNQKHMPQL